MRNWIIFILVAVVAVLLWAIFLDPESGNIQNHVDSVKVIRHQIDSLKIRQYELEQELRRDSIEKASEIRKRDIVIAGLNSKIRSISLVKATPSELDSTRIALYGPTDDDTVYCMPISHARESLADGLKSRLQDSLLVVDAEKIELLQQSNTDMYANFTQQVKSLKQQVQLSEDVNKHYEAIADIYKSDYKREKRKGKVFKVLAPVALVFGLLVGK